jgi:hypothetical protein
MKFTILLLLFFWLSSSSLFAQNGYTVKGSVVDTSVSARLVNSTIMVLNAKDSTLRSFVRVKADGLFNIDNLIKGKFILLVTYPGYADYVERFSLDSSKISHDFGKVNLILKAKLLADVIIQGKRAAIKIKGDTTEFDARAYVVQPNAKVEDLLKQLPGIQIDKDGKITAEGKAVNKVLVDGEEFFGDDPTLVTKNIRADMVDKVQLYDKKSDQAAFTGIDDGQKTKTINIKLKEDKKNGYFGKVDVGIGTNDYYEGQALYNKFKAKQKFAVYATVGNNGKTGLGWRENQQYGSSDNVQVGDDGGISIFFNGSGDGLDSFNGQYDGQGTPLARTSGLHYDTKWNSDKESINTNYKIGSLQVDGVNNSLLQNNTPKKSLNSVSDQTFHNFIFRQKLDATYQIKLDTASNLKIVVDGTFKNAEAKNNYISSSSGTNGILLNNSTRNITNNDNSQIFDASAFYTHKFKKKGRTFSASVSEAINQTTSNGYLKSVTNFYDASGKIDSVQNVDQNKTSTLKSAVLKTNFTYTEPLSKTISVIFNYGLGISSGVSDTKSFNQSSPKVYNILVDSLSNNFKLNELTNQVGAVLNLKKNKTIFNFGTKVSNVNFNQIDELTGKGLKRDFINWNPQGNFQYKFSQQKSFNINYQGNTTQPTINQIQPVIVNTDPLNTILGNPNLTPSFSNRFYLNYNSYKVLSDQSIYLYGQYSFTSNPIVSNLTTDTLTGKSTSQYINLGNKKQSNFYFSSYVSRKLEKADFNIGGDLSLNGDNSYNLSNGQLNFTKSYTYSGQLNLSRYKEKKYDISLSFGPNYTVSGSSLQPGINNNGRGFTANAYFNLYLPGKFQISSDGNYEFKAKTQTFNQDFNRTLINASLVKKFLKSDNLKLTLTGNDLLNQNVGFSRNINGNFITQNSYTTIKRYFMLSLVWDFNSIGGTKPKE